MSPFRFFTTDGFATSSLGLPDADARQFIYSSGNESCLRQRF
ncbi:hypothetical protein TOL_2734 [Thalassolituus oleivorans MIL-1]|uniref:Uncharacterized protein n=1 Tax=Thalassolituus oleivorans MIL-1 TaxID=1298593 RepID=M5DTA5_9GAMM|nr:hypothetical protein TOL_2734 [Thalassolituus oleivorans MIL-1]